MFKNVNKFVEMSTGNVSQYSEQYARHPMGKCAHILQAGAGEKQWREKRREAPREQREAESFYTILLLVHSGPFIFFKIFIFYHFRKGGIL